MLGKTTMALVAGVFMAGTGFSTDASAHDMCQMKCFEKYAERAGEVGNTMSYRSGDDYTAQFSQAANCMNVCLHNCPGSSMYKEHHMWYHNHHHRHG